MNKEIRNVFVVKGDAEDCAFGLRNQGFKVRVAQRAASALGVSVPIWVVVVTGRTGRIRSWP